MLKLSSSSDHISSTWTPSTPKENEPLSSSSWTHHSFVSISSYEMLTKATNQLGEYSRITLDKAPISCTHCNDENILFSFQVNGLSLLTQKGMRIFFQKRKPNEDTASQVIVNVKINCTFRLANTSPNTESFRVWQKLLSWRKVRKNPGWRDICPHTLLSNFEDPKNLLNCSLTPF